MKIIPKKLFSHPSAFLFPNNGKKVRLSLTGWGVKCCIHKKQVEKLQACARKRFNKINMQISKVANDCHSTGQAPGLLSPNAWILIFISVHDCNHPHGLMVALLVP